MILSVFQINKISSNEFKTSYKAQASQVALVVKDPSANAGDVRDMSSIPGSGRSPGEEHGKPTPMLDKSQQKLLPDKRQGHF